MMDISVFSRFQKVTGYNIQPFLEGYVLFSRNYYPLVVKYYSGESVDMGRTFGLLDKLLAATRRIEPLFNMHASQLDTISFWELLDLFTDCQTKLWTINNSSRWLRSAIIDRYSNSIVTNRVLRTHETMEAATATLGYSSPDDDWVDVARRNALEEENYSPVGANPMFKLDLKVAGNFNVQNIVDNLSEQNILGKDILKELEIADGDLLTVKYGDAVRQTLDTILGCFKGSIPEFPSYGFPPDICGTTVKAISYPIIFKDLLDMFSSDGRWNSVDILDLKTEDDCVYIKIQAKTITNDSIITNIQL